MEGFLFILFFSGALKYKLLLDTTRSRDTNVNPGRGNKKLLLLCSFSGIQGIYCFDISPLFYPFHVFLYFPGL